jgi:hypothetical protein
LLRLRSGSILMLRLRHWRDMMAKPEPAPHDGDPYADRRVYPRVSVALPAFLQAAGQRHAVQLLDVSAGGAKLNCSTGLAAGTKVVLDCGTLSRAAEVRWQNDGIMGVKFEAELDGWVVSALIERSTALAALMKTRA